MTGSISDKVYHGLRNSIISLRLKPGDEININKIAEKLEASRSPVRDALLKLEKEGLVEILPQRGTKVSRINLDRMHEERFLRGCLEEQTLELFIAGCEEGDLLRLKENLASQKKSLKEEDNGSFQNLDDEFHRIFFEVADKKMCWEIIQNMSGHYRRVRLLNLRNPGVPANIYAQHLALFGHIQEKDSAMAMELMKRHLSQIFTDEKVLQEEFPDYFTSRKNSENLYC